MSNSRNVVRIGNYYGSWLVKFVCCTGVLKAYCVCECGQEKYVGNLQLLNGKSTNCGCVRRRKFKALRAEGLGGFSRKTHGHSIKGKNKTYSIWLHMRKRCRNPKSTGYKNYGGRGIKICSEWEKYETFLADMGEVPDKHSLDRIDVNGDYSKENCRWANVFEQANNKRTNINLTYNNKTQTVAEWAREIGLNVNTLRSRLKLGWDVQRALTTSVIKV